MGEKIIRESCLGMATVPVIWQQYSNNSSGKNHKSFICKGSVAYPFWSDSRQDCDNVFVLYYGLEMSEKWGFHCAHGELFSRNTEGHVAIQNLTVMKEIQLKNQGVDRIQATVTRYWNRYIVSTESIYLTVQLNYLLLMFPNHGGISDEGREIFEWFYWKWKSRRKRAVV